MVIFYKVVAFLGGLAMFLYGMRVMGDGLKSSSGGAMKNALAKVTNRPFMGFILGALVTAAIQSSTACIVITVGLVGAGFLTFRQSIGIVLGANVGTAITAQIIRLMDINSGADSILYFFKADNLAPMSLIIGIVLIMFTRSRTTQNAGNIAAGFGVLFMGLIYMTDAVSEFSNVMTSMLGTFEHNYPLGFLAGVGVTGVVQSSSAVVGIIQSVASSIGVTFSGVFAVIIGVNIGDCLTTYLVSRIGAKPVQVRTAMIHIIYNIFAAALIIVVLIIGRSTGLISDDLWFMTMDSGGVANVHGIFRLVPAIVLLPFSGLFANIAEKIVKDKPLEEEDRQALEALDELDDRLVSSPGIALDQVQHLITHMSEIALHNYDACVKQIYEFDPERDARIQQREDLLDKMTDAANSYIVSLSQYVTTEKDEQKQNYMLKALICYERIGDLAVNITKSVATIREIKRPFSQIAFEELKIAIDACYEILELTTRAFIENEEDLARKVEPIEEVIDDLVEEIAGRHVQRMLANKCDPVGGIEFQNIITNLEHVSDKCSDMALYILEQTDDTISGQEHQYLYNLHRSDDETYTHTYKTTHDNYFGQLKELERNLSEKTDNNIR